MNFKSIISLIGLATIACASSKDLYTPKGDKVPEELLHLFNYSFDKEYNEMLISGYQRTCHYNYVDNCGEEKGIIDKSKLSVMKENFDMKNYSQEELCEIISDTCEMIDFDYNPLTGHKRLFTKSGDEVPRELYGLFDYSFDNPDHEMLISGYKRTCYYHYVDNCGEEKGKIDSSKFSNMKENFDMLGRTQEDLCKIIDETCEMINFESNPFTGENKKSILKKKDIIEDNKDENSEKKLLTKNGDKVPEELIHLFNYSFDKEYNEMLISGYQRTCHYNYVDNCGEEKGIIDKSKLSVMKENFDMKNYSQEELCEIISDTCEMIDFDYNPLNGHKRLYTKSGDEVPRELYGLFNYSFDNPDHEMLISGYKRTCYYHYVDNCGEEKGKINSSKFSVLKENFDILGRSQEELCKIIDETCDMINFENNPLTGEKNEITTEEQTVEEANDIKINNEVENANESTTKVEQNNINKKNTKSKTKNIKKTKRFVKHYY